MSIEGIKPSRTLNIGHINLAVKTFASNVNRTVPNKLTTCCSVNK